MANQYTCINRRVQRNYRMDSNLVKSLKALKLELEACHPDITETALIELALNELLDKQHQDKQYIQRIISA